MAVDEGTQPDRFVPEDLPTLLALEKLLRKAAALRMVGDFEIGTAQLPIGSLPLIRKALLLAADHIAPTTPGTDLPLGPSDDTRT